MTAPSRTIPARCWCCHRMYCGSSIGGRITNFCMLGAGFGCEPHSSGRAVFATCLSDGETARWNREDFIGVLDEKYLPDWAREKLEELMTQEQTDAPTMGGMNMK